MTIFVPVEALAGVCSIITLAFVLWVLIAFKVFRKRPVETLSKWFVSLGAILVYLAPTTAIVTCCYVFFWR